MTSVSGKHLYRRYGKRLLDIAVSVMALILLSPVFAIVAVAVRAGLGSPVFFRQERPGLHGRSFYLVKFRSMTDARDAQGNLLPPAQRLTRFGRVLRSTSLDELPEIWNVLKGEMSLVGPRPLLVDYLRLYTPQQNRRHTVLPGITGWAQVQGRNALTWEEKFTYDVWYVDNLSLALDLRIMALTFWQVFRRHGISPASQELMPKFTGSTGELAAREKEL